jgi:hypothetical protein
MAEQPKALAGNPTGANQYGSGIGLPENPIPNRPMTLAEAGIDKNLAHRARAHERSEAGREQRTPIRREVPAGSEVRVSGAGPRRYPGGYPSLANQD